MLIKSKVIIITILTISSFIISAPVSAGCKSDCSDEYESERSSCDMLWPEADESEDLTICIEDAKSEYENCVEECDS